MDDPANPDPLGSKSPPSRPGVRSPGSPLGRSPCLSVRSWRERSRGRILQASPALADLFKLFGPPTQRLGIEIWQRAGQLTTGANPELAEHVVQVPLGCPGA